MTSRKMIVLALALSILSLVFLIAQRYGWIRYMSVHVRPLETYVEQYKKTKASYSSEKTGSDRIVVCFTADAKSIQKCKPFLNSILDQSVPVDDIAVTMPTAEDMVTVPFGMKKILSVNTTNNNVKDATKDIANLVCAVMREPESKTRIILVRSDVVYGKDFVQNLLENSVKNPDKIVYGSDRKTLTDGVLIKPGFFSSQMCNTKSTTGTTNSCADLIQNYSKSAIVAGDYQENYGCI